MSKSYTRISKLCFLSFLITSSLALNACNGKIKSEAKYPTGLDRNITGDDIYGERESVFGDGGISLLSKKKNTDSEDTNGMSINSYLWRASLDTVSFMPLASADPFGGTIITDWYTSPESPNERFKINAFILSRELKTDGIRVRTFKQTLKNKKWVDETTDEKMASKLEDAILTRARQLRVAKIGSTK